MLEPLEFVEAARSDGTAVVMDVRRPSEYAEGHLADAVNLDWLDQAAFRKGLEQLDKGRTYYIYCRRGRRSRIIRKTKRFAIPERAVYFLKTKRTAGVLPHPKIFDRLTPVFT